MPPPAGPLTLWLAGDLLDQMAAEAERHRPNETGGVLLGHRNGRDVVVRRLVDAGPAAVRWPTGMRPDGEYQEDAVAAAFKETDGAVTYLGDWHSHPDTIGHPSPCDRRTLRNIATDRDALCPTPVMVILGSRQTGKWLPIVWGARLGRLGRFGPITVDRLALRSYTAAAR